MTVLISTTLRSATSVSFANNNEDYFDYLTAGVPTLTSTNSSPICFPGSVETKPTELVSQQSLSSLSFSSSSPPSPRKKSSFGETSGTIWKKRFAAPFSSEDDFTPLPTMISETATTPFHAMPALKRAATSTTISTSTIPNSMSSTSSSLSTNNNSMVSGTSKTCAGGFATTEDDFNPETASMPTLKRASTESATSSMSSPSMLMTASSTSSSVFGLRHCSEQTTPALSRLLPMLSMPTQPSPSISQPPLSPLSPLSLLSRAVKGKAVKEGVSLTRLNGSFGIVTCHAEPQPFVSVVQEQCHAQTQPLLMLVLPMTIGQDEQQQVLHEYGKLVTRLVQQQELRQRLQQQQEKQQQQQQRPTLTKPRKSKKGKKAGGIAVMGVIPNYHNNNRGNNKIFSNKNNNSSTSKEQWEDFILEFQSKSFRFPLYLDEDSKIQQALMQDDHRHHQQQQQIETRSNYNFCSDINNSNNNRDNEHHHHQQQQNKQEQDHRRAAAAASSSLMSTKRYWNRFRFQPSLGPLFNFPGTMAHKNNKNTNSSESSYFGNGNDGITGGGLILLNPRGEVRFWYPFRTTQTTIDTTSMTPLHNSSSPLLDCDAILKAIQAMRREGKTALQPVRSSSSRSICSHSSSKKNRRGSITANSSNDGSFNSSISSSSSYKQQSIQEQP